eukprot:gene6379-4604_t
MLRITCSRAIRALRDSPSCIPLYPHHSRAGNDSTGASTPATSSSAAASVDAAPPSGSEPTSTVEMHTALRLSAALSHARRTRRSSALSSSDRSTVGATATVPLSPPDPTEEKQVSMPLPSPSSVSLLDSMPPPRRTLPGGRATSPDPSPQLVSALGRSAYIRHLVRHKSRLVLDVAANEKGNYPTSKECISPASSPSYLQRHLSWVEQGQRRWTTLSGRRQLAWALRSPQGARLSRALFRGSSCRRRSSVGLSCRATNFQGVPTPVVAGAHPSSGSPSGESSAQPPLSPSSLQIISKSQHRRPLVKIRVMGAPVRGACDSSGVARLLGDDKGTLCCKKRGAASPLKSIGLFQGRSQCGPVPLSYLPSTAPPLDTATERIRVGAVQAQHHRHQRASWRRTARRMLQIRGGDVTATSTFLKDLKEFQRRRGDQAASEDDIPTVHGSVQHHNAGTARVLGESYGSGKESVNSMSSVGQAAEEADFVDYCEALRLTSPRRAYVMAKLWPHLEEVERSPSEQLKLVRKLVREFSQEFDELNNRGVKEATDDGLHVSPKAIVAELVESTRSRLSSFQQHLPKLKELLQDVSKEIFYLSRKLMEHCVDSDVLAEERCWACFSIKNFHTAEIVPIQFHLNPYLVHLYYYYFHSNLNLVSQRKVPEDLVANRSHYALIAATLTPTQAKRRRLEYMAYPPEDSGDAIKSSLNHIEELLQRGNQLLYGEDDAAAAAAVPAAAAAAAVADGGPSPGPSRRKNSRVSIDPNATMKPHNSEYSRGASQGRESSLWSEEERQLEIDRFFEEDAERIAKIKKENRRLRLAEVRRQAKEPPKPLRRGATAAEEDDPEPDKVDLEEIRSRIHREIEAYRAKITFLRMLQSPGAIVRLREISLLHGLPIEADSASSNEIENRSLPIWERLYAQGNQRRRSVSESTRGLDEEGLSDEDDPSRFDHRSSLTRLGRTNSAPVQSRVSKAGSSGPKPAVPRGGRGSSPEAKPPIPPSHVKGDFTQGKDSKVSHPSGLCSQGRDERSDSPINAPPLRNHGKDERLRRKNVVKDGSDIELDDENAPTMPFITPLDLRDLN